MIEASTESSYWTHTLVIQATLGIWFAASHQPWIVRSHQSIVLSATDGEKNLHFVFLELCARPEYTAMIRQEIQSIDKCDLRGINSLPILDSFIKEPVRVNPLDKSKSSSTSSRTRNCADMIGSGNTTKSAQALYILKRRATCVDW